MNFIKTTNKKHEEEITKLLQVYSKNTEDPISNFNLAKYYDSINHSSSAVSFYTRCAERSNDKLLQYSCLIGAAKCYEKEGYRELTVNNLIKTALLTDVARPEAYFYLCKILLNKIKNTQNIEEQAKLWHDCYLYSCLGLKFTNNDLKELYVSDVYPGEHGLIFMKALSSWHCGMADESKSLFLSLINSYQSVMDDVFKSQIIENIKKFNMEF